MSGTLYDRDFFTDNDLPLLGWEEHLGHDEDAFDASLPPIDNPFVIPNSSVPVHMSGAPALTTRKAAPQATAAVEPAPVELAEVPFALDGGFEVGFFDFEFPPVRPTLPRRLSRCRVSPMSTFLPRSLALFPVATPFHSW